MNRVIEIYSNKNKSET